MEEETAGHPERDRRRGGDADRPEMAVRSRPKDLRDLAYDMEDIWDEFAYQVMRRKLTGAEVDKPGTSQLRKFVSPSSVSFDPSLVVRLVKIRPRNGEITSRLQDIHAREGGFGLGKVSGVSTWQRSPSTISAAYVPWVFGRDEDKGVILDLLQELGPCENNIGIISIVGMGGVGKKMLVYIWKRAKGFALKVRLN